MQKKLVAIFCAGALMLGFVSAAQAQKVGFCDFRRLASEAPQFKDAQQTIEAEFQPRYKQLQAQQKDFEAKVQKYQRDSATMAEAERGKTERDLRDVQISLGRKQKELEEDAQLRQQELGHTVEAQMFAEVERVAKSQGYDLIVRDAAFRSDNIDITASVLASLQAKAKTSVAPATAPAAKPASK